VVIAVGATLAAVNAYMIAQGIGRPLAERVIQSEMGDGSGGGSPVARQLAAVQEVIQVGRAWGGSCAGGGRRGAGRGAGVGSGAAGARGQLAQGGPSAPGAAACRC
jgi:hypothetical protein